MMKTIFILLLAILTISACTPKYIAKVSPETKTKFGMEVSAPNVAVFFVENTNSSIGLEEVERHKKVADSLYNKLGPAREDFFIARTNARDFKFNVANKTYYIEVQNLPKRTAMILFDGKNKPTVYFNPEKYAEQINKVR